MPPARTVSGCVDSATNRLPRGSSDIVAPVAVPTADTLDAALRAQADPERAQREKQYLKSELEHYGVPVPTMHQIAARQSRALDRQGLLSVATQLWDEPGGSPVHDRRFLAADMLAARSELLAPSDAQVLERMLRQARTWAIVDTLAPRVVGPLADRYSDDMTPVLDAWARDDDYWLRRSALLAHLIPLRDGRGDWARFTRYADLMISDREFFVAKALGWVLRDTGRRRPGLVVEWVRPRVADMSAISVKEALKPLPPEVQQELRSRRTDVASRPR
jgi:3-methyladenine DNA glycosylase AlkD